MNDRINTINAALRQEGRMDIYKSLLDNIYTHCEPDWMYFVNSIKGSFGRRINHEHVDEQLKLSQVLESHGNGIFNSRITENNQAGN